MARENSSGISMQGYIINLDSAVDRWRFVESNFRASGIPYQRVSGVNGRELQFPIPEYSQRRYRLFSGRRTNPGQVGCYLSHIKALRTFLASDHRYAIVCEDDIQPVPHLRQILLAAIRHAATWDILRLCGFHDGHPVPYAALDDCYSLAVNRTRLCGTGAYMVHRPAAEVLVEKLLPMRLAIDHALDREWFYGLRAVAVNPLPITQKDHTFRSQTAGPAHEKLPVLQRYWTTFPYRAFNETSRLIARTRQLRQLRKATKTCTDLQVTTG